MQKLVKQLTS